MEMLALVVAGWFAAMVSLATLIFDWTGSLFVAIPAAVCLATAAALLLVRPDRR